MFKCFGGIPVAPLLGANRRQCTGPVHKGKGRREEAQVFILYRRIIEQKANFLEIIWTLILQLSNRCSGQSERNENYKQCLQFPYLKILHSCSEG